MTEPDVMWLTDPAATEAGVTGGCGAHLARLAQAGFPVPAGFVVSTAAYLRTVEAAGVGDELRRLTSATLPEGPAALDELAARLYTAATALHPPADLAATVVDAHLQLGASTPVAVRTSAAPATDGGGPVGPAGQVGQVGQVAQTQEHVVFCWVHGHDMVLRRLHDCWASLWTSRAVTDRARRKIAGEPSVAVVVQAMVDADRAGVASTDVAPAGIAAADPAAGRPAVVVKAVLGLGEAVLSGEVEPDVYTIDQATLTPLAGQVGRQEFILHRECDGGTCHLPLTPSRATARVLDDTQARRVAELARDVAGHYGAPVDVQWALAGDDLWLLQAGTRPRRHPRPAGRRHGRPVPERADRGDRQREGDRGGVRHRRATSGTAPVGTAGTTTTGTTGTTGTIRRHHTRRDLREGREAAVRAYPTC